MKTRTIEREVYINNDLQDFLSEKSRSTQTLQTISLQELKAYNYKAKIIIEVEEEPLTFERIKKECVPMETIFIDEGGNEWFYIGFSRDGDLVVEYALGQLRVLIEETIKDWSIKNG